MASVCVVIQAGPEEGEVHGSLGLEGLANSLYRWQYSWRASRTSKYRKLARYPVAGKLGRGQDVMLMRGRTLEKGLRGIRENFASES